MNAEWSNLNKNFRGLLKKPTFSEAIEALIQLRTTLLDAWIESFKDLDKADFSKMPLINSSGYENKTVAYSMYHVFRIEDIVSNSLIQKKDEVFVGGNYQAKLNSPIKTTGNELVREAIGEFSEQLNIEELVTYSKAVFDNSNAFLRTLTYDDLRKVFDSSDKSRLEALGVVSTDSEAHWLIDYWCSKDIKGLLFVPFSRHWINHLEASNRIISKLKKSK